MLHIVCLISR